MKRAGVARSTFYDHFPDKRALLCAAMEPLLETLAAAAAGTAARAELAAFVDHLWENRAMGRVLLASNAMRLIVRALEERIRDSTPLASIASRGVANAQLGTIRDWLQGDVRASADEMSDWLGQAQV